MKITLLKALFVLLALATIVLLLPALLRVYQGHTPTTLQPLLIYKLLLQQPVQQRPIQRKVQQPIQQPLEQLVKPPMQRPVQQPVTIADSFKSEAICNSTNTVYFGIATPKTASNFMDKVVNHLFKLHSCHEANKKKRRSELEGPMYCYMRQQKKYQAMLAKIFPRSKGCDYMCTHVDAGIMTVKLPPAVKCVRKLTMLREPVSRLRSAIVYAGGKTLGFIKNNLNYAGDNHMTRMIAGQSHMCRTLPKVTNHSEILRVAKHNLEHVFHWFGILEYKEESFEMLGFKGNLSDIGVVRPKLKSSGGTRFSRDDILSQRKHFELDIALYDFAVELHRRRYAAFKRGERPVIPSSHYSPY